MDIPAMSVGLSQGKAQQEVQMSVMKMVMDSVKGSSAGIDKLMEVNSRIIEQALPAHLGTKINIEA